MFMFCVSALVVQLAWAAPPAATTASAPAPLPLSDRLLTYRDEKGKTKPVKTAADWAKRRAQILAGMQEVMGPLPDRSKLPALDIRITEETKEEGYTRYKLTFAAEGQDRIPAYLLVPDGVDAAHKAPAMIALHQTTAQGKDEPVGLGVKTNLRYGLELAQRGYVVLAPDYPSFGDYQYDFLADDYESGSMKGIFNHMRCVDLLSSREDVDATRIGVIGHSLGGHNAIFVGAFDERLKVVVTSSGWTPFHDYYGGKLLGWTSDRYMPRIKEVYELDPDRVPFQMEEAVAAIAPRAFFSNSPLNDHNFAVEGVRKAAAVIQPVYNLLGAPDMFQVVYPDCGHDFPPEVRRAAYAFIDRVLKHTPRQDVP